MNPLEGFIAALIVAFGPVAYTVMQIIEVEKRHTSDANGVPRFNGTLYLLSAFVLGVGYALVTKTNFLTNPGTPAGLVNIHGTWAEVLTGLGIGGLAAYYYERKANAATP